MEPLIKSENYSYSFYRKIIENIKQTKDKQNPDVVDANKVCAASSGVENNLMVAKSVHTIWQELSLSLWLINSAQLWNNRPELQKFLVVHF